MKITSVKIIPIDQGRLKAFAEVVFDDCFIITDLKVVQGHRALFVSMPSKRLKNGTYQDMAHPLNQETRTYIEQEVIGAYNAEMAASSTPMAMEA